MLCTLGDRQQMNKWMNTRTHTYKTIRWKYYSEVDQITTIFLKGKINLCSKYTIQGEEIN